MTAMQEALGGGRKGYNSSPHLSPRPSPRLSPRPDSHVDHDGDTGRKGYNAAAGTEDHGLTGLENGVAGLGLGIQEMSNGTPIVNGSYAVGGREGASGGGRKGYNRTPSPSVAGRR